MLHVLAESNTAGVRAHGNSELCCKQENGDHLIHATQPATVDLTEAYGIGLHELLEDHAILTLFARGNANRRDGLCDCGVTEDVVGARRLLDPPRVEPCQLAHAGDRLIDVPHLIRIHHELAVRPDLGANDRCTAHVVGEVTAHLYLEARPSPRQSP